MLRRSDTHASLTVEPKFRRTAVRPASFNYHKAIALSDALEMLEEFGADARPIAGGQSLVPMMNLRLARPEHLIDINDLSLDTIEQRADVVHVGALVRHDRYAKDPLIRAHFPAFIEAASWIGHPTIRMRGTMGGSISHADPTAELPAVCVLHDATIIAKSKVRERRIPAADFFISAYEVRLEPGEMVIGVDFPIPQTPTIGAFEEFAERHGDFAMVSVGVVLQYDANRTITNAAVVLSGVEYKPFRAATIEDALRGSHFDDLDVVQTARLLTNTITPLEDNSASADFRKDLVVELTRRAVHRALEKAIRTS